MAAFSPGTCCPGQAHSWDCAPDPSPVLTWGWSLDQGLSPALLIPHSEQVQTASPTLPGCQGGSEGQGTDPSCTGRSRQSAFSPGAKPALRSCLAVQTGPESQGPQTSTSPTKPPGCVAWLTCEACWDGGGSGPQEPAWPPSPAAWALTCQSCPFSALSPQGPQSHTAAPAGLPLSSLVPTSCGDTQVCRRSRT